MSGHSKWSKIKHKKGAADAKKGVIFTKLGNAITIAAKQGGDDPETNFSLRLAMDKAKQANMPKDNIERAIKRGMGELGGGQLEEVVYEGFLSGGSDKIPIIIQGLTDNKNRAVSEIKNILEKSGGSLAGQGSVMWQFEKRGVINFGEIKLDNELELKLIDAGAQDIEENNEEIIIYTKAEDLQKVKENLDKQNIEVKSAELQFVAKEKIDISDEVGEKIQKLFEQLDENDDVTNYYTNII